MIEEFKECSDYFNGRGMKFKYDDLHSVWLKWSMYGGRRWISLRNDLSRTVNEYRIDYSDVPISILRASIKFFKCRIRDEEKKKLEKENFHNYASWLTHEKTRKRYNTGS